MKTVTLLYPIKIDGKTVKELKIRKPTAGELRGINLMDIGQMKTETIVTILSRVATPHLTQEQAFSLDVADLGEAAATVWSFFDRGAATPPEPKS